MRKDQKRIALYVDIENHASNCFSQGLDYSLSPEISELKNLGAIVIARSYGDIFKLHTSLEVKNDLRRMLQRNLIQHHDIPFQNPYKNSAAIHLAIDVMADVYSDSAIDIVAIVASDRDYIPLYLKLHALGVELIGIGGSNDATAELCIQACDSFWFHEELIKIRGAEAARLVIPEPGPAVDQREEPVVNPFEERDRLGVVELEEWFLGKMKVQIPPYDVRLKIYGTVVKVLEALREDEEYTLGRLSNKVYTKVARHSEQSTVFRTLFALFRTNAFICSAGEGPMNPRIHGLFGHRDIEAYDGLFLLNALRAYVREQEQTVNPWHWSMAFYGNLDKAEYIREIVTSA